MATALPKTNYWNRRDWLHLLAIAAVGWSLFGWRVERRGLWSAHEGRAAQDAQSILDTGEWLLPRLYIGTPDYQKPPLYYWCVACIAMIRGGEVDAFAIRLPAVLSAIATLAIVYVVAAKRWDRTAALLSVAVLASITRFAWLARVGRIDMPLTLCCTTALLCYWSLSWHRARWKVVMFYAALSCGVLFKGPVAGLLTLLPVLLHAWIERGGRKLGFAEWLRSVDGDLSLARGLAAATAICAPWYLFAIWKTRGSYFWEFFVYHNLERALGSSEGLKSGPIWFYLPRLLVDAFPWSLLLLPLAIAVWQKRRSNALSAPESADQRFFLCWIGTQFAFLSLVSFKRADYLLPLYPCYALLMVDWLRDRAQRFAKRRVTRNAGNYGRRARLVVATAFAAVIATGPLWVWGSIEFLKKGVVRSLLKVDAVSENFNGTDRFMLDHIERIMREHAALLAIAGLVVLGCVGLFHVGWHNRENRCVALGFGMPWAVGFLFQVHLFLPALDPLREMSRFGSMIRYIASPDRPIHYLGKFDADLVFHAGRPARMIFDLDDLSELGQTQEPSFVVVTAKDLHALRKDARLEPWREVADNCQTAFGEHRDPRILLTNRPQAIADRLRGDFHR